MRQMIIGTHESIWWETIRHFPGDDIAACFDQEGQRTWKKAQLRWKQSCRNKDEPGEPDARFYSPNLFPTSVRFIGAQALVNCLEDKVGGKYKRETRTAGVEFFLSSLPLIHLRHGARQEVWGSASTCRRTWSGNLNAADVEPGETLLPPQVLFFSFPPLFHDWSLKKGLIMGCLWLESAKGYLGLGGNHV